MVQKVVLSANDDGKNFAVVSLRQVISASIAIIIYGWDENFAVCFCDARNV